VPHLPLSSAQADKVVSIMASKVVAALAVRQEKIVLTFMLSLGLLVMEKKVLGLVRKQKRIILAFYSGSMIKMAQIYE
jgi:hypothetical protein